ncbi:MAG TPA: metallophosphoesterase [Spirochaetota bacterium]|nr:metallophosphoesterase [Spirochaetota bacterium]
MKIKYFNIIILVCLSLCTAAGCNNTDNTTNEQNPVWKFAVISDTQGNKREEKNKSCINDKILKLIAGDIAVEKPDLVLVSGDLVNGWFRNGGTDFAAQYASWKKVMDPVFRMGIKVFAVRGNHDSGPERFVLPPLPEHLEPPAGSLMLLENEFKHAMIQPYTPLNGPGGEKGLTFSVVHKNACIIGLDQFTGGQHKVNQVWLDRQLSVTRQMHLFVFGHEPAFEADHKDNLSFYSKDRNRFWNSIGKSGGRIYFCGHDHFYNRALINDSSGNPIWQIIGGTGGAKLRTWSGSYRESERVQCEYYNNAHHGYILVTVNGPAVKVEWRALMDVSANEWQILDEFSYTSVSGVK